MKLGIRFGTAYCYTREFVINGVDADIDDFGEKYDHAPELAPACGCGNMMFESKPPTQKILDKYHISAGEYSKVCGRLETGLCFGRCCWCA